jgi:predicted dithiol-disulfide oxidoreductase (DUF899 family)
MPDHQIATKEQWVTAREELIAREKEHTRHGDELARQRRKLPWVRVEKGYAFQAAAGRQSLADLFDGRSQLVVYNFMFGPDYEAGCPVCSSIADSFNGVLAHLQARDVTMICVSRAPLDKLLSYRERMGWSFTWVSSDQSDFSLDFDHVRTREQINEWFGDGVPEVPARFAQQCGTDLFGYLSEGPGLSVFTLSDQEVYLTYSTTARGLEPLMAYYGILDLVPRGRDEGQPPDPSWMRRHDEFATT